MKCGLCNTQAIDLQFDFVPARIVLSSGEVTNGLAFGNCDAFTRRDLCFTPLEYLLRGAAAGFDIVDDVIHGEALRFARRRSDPGNEVEGIAEF